MPCAVLCSVYVCVLVNFFFYSLSLLISPVYTWIPKMIFHPLLYCFMFARSFVRLLFFRTFLSPSAKINFHFLILLKVQRAQH